MTVLDIDHDLAVQVVWRVDGPLQRSFSSRFSSRRPGISQPHVLALTQCSMTESNLAAMEALEGINHTVLAASSYPYVIVSFRMCCDRLAVHLLDSVLFWLRVNLRAGFCACVQDSRRGSRRGPRRRGTPLSPTRS